MPIDFKDPVRKKYYSFVCLSYYYLKNINIAFQDNSEVTSYE